MVWSIWTMTCVKFNPRGDIWMSACSLLSCLQCCEETNDALSHARTTVLSFSPHDCRRNHVQNTAEASRGKSCVCAKGRISRTVTRLSCPETGTGCRLAAPKVYCDEQNGSDRALRHK